MSYTIREIRQALVAGAEVEWERPVKDFADGQTATPERIHRYWRACGWQWYLDQYSDGTYTEQWQDGPVQSWCGIFVAYIATHVGDHIAADRCANVTLKRRVATDILPSTDRLYAHRSEFDQPDPARVQPGDIITTGDGPDGSHIRLVRNVDPKDGIGTTEGNGTGRFPGGDRGEGVVHDAVRFDDIAQTYRFRRTHFVGADAPTPL